MTAIEIAVPTTTRAVNATIEIVVGDAIVRCDVGADVEYVASLLRALRKS